MASNSTDSSRTKPFSGLFVCLGSFCRSPAAEGVLRSVVGDKGLLSRFSIDSSGTIYYHEVLDILEDACGSLLDSILEDNL